MLFRKRTKQSGGRILDNLIKVRGKPNRMELREVRDEVMNPSKKRRWEPRAMGRAILPQAFPGVFDYNGRNRGEFFRWMRDKLPMIGTGVWTWVRLTATELIQSIEGTVVERDRAAIALNALDRRILESPYGRGSGLDKLTEGYFLELFTTGRFAGEAILTADGRSIDHFRFIDPYRVGWRHGERGWTPFITDDDGEEQGIDPQRFYYGTLGVDLDNPAGVEPLASIPFVAEVEQLMLEDMARSSHNAGTPRLQIKIARPELYSWENDRQYADRANRYFQDTVSEFQHLEPDDNVFTWDDVEVTVVGQSGVGHSWRLAREQVIEDVITGLKLFPWVLGRTHKTTQNWVQSQFDLLMEMVRAHQKSGAGLIDWLCALELHLQGIDARVSHRFAMHPDPFRLERAKAVQIELANIDLKVEKGYISKDDGAKEMGYVKAYSGKV